MTDIQIANSSINMNIDNQINKYKTYLEKIKQCEIYLENKKAVIIKCE